MGHGTRTWAAANGFLMLATLLCFSKTKMEDDDEGIHGNLNVFSKKFNPLDALYTERTIIPVTTAPELDNVAKFETLISQYGITTRMDQVEVIHEKKASEPSTSIEGARESRFLPHQEPIKTTKKNVKVQNVLIRMEEAKGPLGFLKNCVENRRRIKVFTRNAAGIRGYCHGFIAAFDNHWNLAMEDVKEVWSRKIKRKKILIGEGKEPPVMWKAVGPMVTPPKVVVIKKEKGMETCERHVNQMLMRGEHVAFISVSDT